MKWNPWGCPWSSQRQQRPLWWQPRGPWGPKQCPRRPWGPRQRPRGPWAQGNAHGVLGVPGDAHGARGDGRGVLVVLLSLYFKFCWMSGVPSPRSSGELIISSYPVQVFIDKSSLKKFQYQYGFNLSSELEMDSISKLEFLEWALIYKYLNWIAWGYQFTRGS